MTTIAWDGRYLAADRQMTIGHNRSHELQKIKRIVNQDRATRLIAMSGDTVAALMLSDWVENGENEDQFPTIKDDAVVLVVDPNEKRLVEYYHSGPRYVPLVFGQIYAIGSGAPFAIGAMSLGATAEQAVRIACANDVYSGGTVDVLSAW